MNYFTDRHFNPIYFINFSCIFEVWNWKWKGVSATLWSGRYTLSYPRGIHRPSTTKVKPGRDPGFVFPRLWWVIGCWSSQETGRGGGSTSVSEASLLLPVWRSLQVPISTIDQSYLTSSVDKSPVPTSAPNTPQQYQTLIAPIQHTNSANFKPAWKASIFAENRLKSFLPKTRLNWGPICPLHKPDYPKWRH